MYSKNHRKGFALIGAIIAACILIAASAALTLSVLNNKVEARRELERSQTANGGDMVGREFLESLADECQTASKGVGGTNSFNTTFLIAALAAGAQGPTNGRNVTIYNFDTNNPSLKNPPTDFLVISTNVLPFQTMVFPHMRFGYVQPGTPFIGRLHQYGVDYSAVAADNLAQQSTKDLKTNKTSGDLVNEKGTLVVNLLEIPDQLGIEGQNISLTAAPNMTLLGGVAGRVIQDLQNAYPGVNMAASVDIQNGVAESARIAALSDATRGLAGAGNKFLASASGATIFMPVGYRGTNTYGIPTATDAFTRYWHPYYQCQLRVTVTTNAAGTYDVKALQYAKGGVNPMTTVLNKTDQPIDMVFNNSDVNWIGVVKRYDAALAGGGGFVNDVEVSIPSLLSNNPTIDSIYVNAPIGMPVVLKDGDTLASPLSVVSANDIYIPTSFATNGVPFSIFAPTVCYGYPGSVVSQVSLYGQRGLTTETGSMGGSPTTIVDGFSNSISAASFDYEPVQTAANLPPIFLKNWLITIWKK